MARMRGVRADMQEAALRWWKQPSPAESALWDALRFRHLDGLRFGRQHVIGSYVLDFYCPTHKLGVEVDGDGHDPAPEHGRERAAFLAARGVTVLHVRADDVLSDLPGVLARIRAEVFGSDG